MSRAEYTGYDAHVEQLVMPQGHWQWVLHGRQGRDVKSYQPYTSKKGAKEALVRHLEKFGAYIRPSARDSGWYRVFRWT